MYGGGFVAVCTEVKTEVVGKVPVTVIVDAAELLFASVVVPTKTAV
jgi:hypothetical protein